MVWNSMVTPMLPHHALPGIMSSVHMLLSHLEGETASMWDVHLELPTGCGVTSSRMVSEMTHAMVLSGDAQQHELAQ